MSNRDKEPSPDTAEARWLPAGFVVSALLLMAFWILWLSVYVVHRTYISAGEPAEGARLESWWAWLLIAGIGWALLNLFWSLRALRGRSEQGYLGHLALTVGCGLIVLGIQSVMLARGFTMTPMVLDYSNPVGAANASATVAQAPAATVAAGDPEEGRKVFSTTCITCHGPSGQGMPNLAPSLVGSQFVASSDDATVANVIRNGRALGDPNNKSGKVMPARGGNPFLTDDQVAHLAAFVRAIQSGGAAVAGSDTPAVQLARWVVPAAKQPPGGLDMRRVAKEKNAGDRLAEQAAERRSKLMRRLTLGLTAVHGFFLLGVVALSSNLLLPRLMSERPRIDPLVGKLSVGGWVVAAVAWLLIAWLCFWWS